MTAIRTLTSVQKQQMNRLLANEALLVALVRRVQPTGLQGLAEEYDAALDRLAVELEPSQQMPELWAVWSDAIAALRKSHENKLQGDQPPGAS